MSEPVQGGTLVADGELSPLFRAWLGGSLDREGAGEAWRRFLLAPPAAAGPAPAWAAAAWRDRWLPELLADQPDDESRRRCAAHVASLAAGLAEVVVTGQQPGFLGGPLYTLYKAAAAVAAAAARTAAGRPTVPLFWYGDDDDDRVEAFAPWLWDPARRALLRATPPDGPADHMVGASTAPDWSRAEAAWLATREAEGGLAAELAAIWRRGREERLGWGRLQRRALLRLFAGSGLLAVSGDDEGLHAAAAPWYAELWPRRDSLARIARSAGEALVAAGFHAQLGEGSLARPLHLAEAGRRLTLSPALAAAPSPPAAGLLRPGVLLRSPVQDWLFRPAGVVVGPGELAYLVQMQEVYAELGMARAPLLPRLFARAVPAGAAPEGNAGPAPIDWPARADALVAGAAAALAAALEGGRQPPGPGGRAGGQGERALAGRGGPPARAGGDGGARDDDRPAPLGASPRATPGADAGHARGDRALGRAVRGAGARGGAAAFRGGGPGPVERIHAAGSRVDRTVPEPWRGGHEQRRHRSPLPGATHG